MSDKRMNIACLLQEGVRRLDAQGVETAQLDARLLLAKATGLSETSLLASREEDCGGSNQAAQDEFEHYLARRLQGEPVSRILGRREFWGMDFAIGADVFDPRPESETLIEAVLRHKRKEAARVLDLGAGSGCLLLSLLGACPEMRGIGIDILPEAVRWARHNARVLEMSSRAHFFVGDWMFDYRGIFDLLLCNPPYIPSAELAGLAAEVRRHDPHTALDGGEDGLAAYRRLADLAPGLLTPEGQMIVEIGIHQAGPVSEIFTLAGLRIDDIIKDLSGHQRAVLVSLTQSTNPPQQDKL